MFLLNRFFVCLCGWNIVIDFKLTSRWARDLKFGPFSEVDDNEWKCEKRRKKKRKGREKDEENEKDENKKLN